jgi:hypothetical protein
METMVGTIEPCSATEFSVTLYASDGSVWDRRVARSYRGALRMLSNHSRRLRGEA